MSRERVSKIMTPNVIEVFESDTAESVYHLFEKHRISGLPVSNKQGEYTGVISKTDLTGTKLLNYIKIHKGLENATIKDFMSHNPPLTVNEDAPIDDAIDIMDSHKVHRVFVVNDLGKMTGIVSTSDVIRQLRFTFEAYL